MMQNQYKGQGTDDGAPAKILKMGTGGGKNAQKQGNKMPKANKSLEDLLDIKLLNTTRAGFIETEGMEKSFQIQQEELVSHLNAQTAKKKFDLKLDDPAGGYALRYSRNGRTLLIGGTGGHLAAFDWMGGRLKTEVTVEEKVQDVCWLQDDKFFAVAQESCVYVYDQSGAEVHALRKQTKPSHLEYLPYHFLLFSACGDNHVRYQDISTGQQIAEWNTKAGISTACTQNRSNGVVLTGHSGGVVNFWSPTMSSPLVKMFTHRGPVVAMGADASGHYLATSGADGFLKTWDMRTFKMLDQYKLPGRSVSSMSISQSGLLAASSGPCLTVWKDIFKSHQKTPYMRHTIRSQSIKQLSFCPFEDVLGVGHTGGFSSIIIPGAGEANFDALEVNPFANKKQKQESQVKQLLDKLQPETIMLDPDCIGLISSAPVDKVLKLQEIAAEANGRPKPDAEKKKMRGKSSAQRRLARKRANIIDDIKSRSDDSKSIQVIKADSGNEPEQKWSSLDRFRSKD